MTLAVLLYNNTIHSVIKMILFDMIHSPRLNPFDLSPRTIINRYTTQHKENLQTLHNTIQNKKAYKCNTKLQGSELV